MKKVGTEEMNKESNKNLILYGIIAVLVLLCVYFYLVNRPLSSSPTQTSDCGSIDNTFLKDACFTNLAMSSNSAEECKYVLSLNQKDLCYIELSKIKRDKTICNSIVDIYYMKPKCFAELQMIGIN